MDGLRRAMGMEDPQGVEENTANYEVYPSSSDLSMVDLAGLQAQLLGHLMPFLRGYIWQRDRFNLQLSTERQAPWQRARASTSSRRRHGAGGAGTSPAGASPAAALAPHWWGSLDFGDNVEDEWFLVWLLLELTRAFPVTARVWDNDGEFLLIEAAYGLPRWLKPETAQNRVWLHGGAFHLVALPRFAGDPLLAPTPTLAQALSAVRGHEIGTLAPPKMQAPLLQRLAGLPERAAASMHVAHALVPACVAHLLRAEPQLVAAAVEAFYYRDPDDVKAASKMAAFPPRHMVVVAPTLSRCLYAQLALQEYAPPRGYPMPMPSDPQYKAAEVGLKLTAGFEMMYANRARFGRRQEEETNASAAGSTVNRGDFESQRGTPAGVKPPAGAAGLSGDSGWAAFSARLHASGYFRGCLPGSAQHSQLLEAAVDAYRQTEAYRSGTASLSAPALHIDELLAQPIDSGSFPPASELPPPSSEAWLAEQAGRQLEAELAQRQQEMERQQQRQQQRQQRKPEPAGGSSGAGGGAPEANGHEEFDPGELAGRLRAFVDMMSGLEGAEVPHGGAAGSKGREGASNGGSTGGTGGSGGDVALDEAAFAAELQKVLGLTGAAMRHATARGAGGGSDDGDSEEESMSATSEEGSSFYSGQTSDADSDLEEDGGSDIGHYPEMSEGPHARHQHQQHRPQRAASASPAAAGPSDVAMAGGGEEEQEEERRRQEGWEADTATDSDDDAAFMEAYGRAMNRQLAATRMAESFERAAAPGGAAAAAAGGPPAGGLPAGSAEQGSSGGAQAGAESEAAELRPIDLDVNLVNSLLASYGEQQGLPGPAGNLAGLMGLKLPQQ